MKKEFLLITSVLMVAFAVNAQTFQRKAQQPAFFMPRSALSTQSQEKLPAIESMNYQGIRAPSVQPVTNSERTEQKIKENPFRKADISANKAAINQKEQEKTVETIKAEARDVVKQNAPLLSEEAFQSENNSKKTLPEQSAISDNSEDYQSIFAEIMRQHKADLSDISKGKIVENPNISAIIQAFNPKVHKISDVIN